MATINNMSKNLGKYLMYGVLILSILYLVNLSVSKFVNKNKNTSDSTNNTSILSTNFIDKNTPVFLNEDYKKDITCSYVPPPTLDGGIRVNFYNSERSLDKNSEESNDNSKDL